MFQYHSSSLFLRAIDQLLLERGAGPGQFLLRGDDRYENIVEWYCDEDKIPTREEIEERFKELNDQWVANEYQRHRAVLYPPMSELADALYHREKNSDNSKLESYIKKCDDVKELFPKDNSGDASVFVNPEGPVMAKKILGLP